MFVLDCSAEIDDFDGDAILCPAQQHNILQLDIAVDNMKRVHVGERAEQLPHDLGDHVFALVSKSLEGFNDGSSSTVLHHYIVFLVVVE